jgi:signal transduction histidine kinase
MNQNEKDIISTLNDTLSSLVTGQASAVAINFRTGDQDVDPVILSLVNKVNALTEKHNQANDFINALSNGDLGIEPPVRNNLVSSFKQLHANLQHLTWQTQQIAMGDYNQEVSFMGDFSVAFNTMTKSLKEKKKLDEQLILYAKELELANNTKDKLFSIVSHDLKSPFYVILGFADLLHTQYDEYSDETRKKFILAIKESAGTSFALLEKLFAWSLAQRNGIKPKPQRINLKEIVDGKLQLLKNTAVAKNITMTNRINPDTTAYADDEMINTVLLNLLNNALKFTNRDGNINIENSRIDGLVQISVADNGVGIPLASIENLFKIKNAFSTLGTSNEIGTGLGLIICKEFIQNNGGDIWVESQPGKGSKFIFTLPSA